MPWVQPTRQLEMIRLLAFGASLTEGYTYGGVLFHPYSQRLAILLQSVQPQAKVTQRGQSGEGTSTMIQRLQEVFEKDGPFSHVVILAGTNDLSKLSSQDIVSNLEKLYSISMQKGALVIAVTLPELEAEITYPNLKTVRLEVNEAIRRSSLATTVVDLATLLPMHSATQEWRELYWTDDGLHMTPEGYDRFGELVFEQLKLI